MTDITVGRPTRRREKRYDEAILSTEIHRLVRGVRAERLHEGAFDPPALEAIQDGNAQEPLRHVPGARPPGAGRTEPSGPRAI